MIGRVVGQVAVSGATILAVQGDLTAQDVDALVNAANEQLAHGGGVAAALSRTGGPAVQRESSDWVRAHGLVGSGAAAVTTAGLMPARWIVHVVGPRWRQGQDNAGLLRRAVRAALDTARDLGASSVAMPAISAGIFGYPRAEATAVIADETVTWLQASRGTLGEVRLVGYDTPTVEDFATALSR
ncbi:MAG: macro domain-containing protein [Egibacteraceae bacterium]